VLSHAIMVRGLDMRRAVKCLAQWLETSQEMVCALMLVSCSPYLFSSLLISVGSRGPLPYPLHLQNLFLELLAPITNVIRHLLQSGDETTAVNAFEIFDDIAESVRHQADCGRRLGSTRRWEPC